MLIHITPRIYIPSAVKSCVITGLKIEQLGVSFSAEQIATRKPYLNKRFHVACRRNNRRATQGLLFSVGAAPREFTVECEWLINGSACAKHSVEYKILDDEMDAVSDNMLLWYADAGRKYKLRWPHWAQSMSPMEAMPRMEFMAGSLPLQPHRKQPQHRSDLVESGRLISRQEVFGMHTLEKDRLFNLSYSDRMPNIWDAFQI